ncbi:MAG: ACT domain-containing protein, partial [Gammaproteobacteria bacterium]|nr:ACT domain-containing protein [Gammaproteobacteria bacterium]
GDAVGPTLYYGAGAGAQATASAVVADVIDVARMMSSPENSVPALGFRQDNLSDLSILPINEIISAYYLRVVAKDKAGVLSDITEILGDFNINIEAVIQKEPRVHDVEQNLSVVILTDEIKESVMNTAIEKIEALNAIGGKVARIRMDRLED